MSIKSYDVSWPLMVFLIYIFVVFFYDEQCHVTKQQEILSVWSCHFVGRQDFRMRLWNEALEWGFGMRLWNEASKWGFGMRLWNETLILETVDLPSVCISLISYLRSSLIQTTRGTLARTQLTSWPLRGGLTPLMSTTSRGWYYVCPSVLTSYVVL